MHGSPLSRQKYPKWPVISVVWADLPADQLLCHSMNTDVNAMLAALAAFRETKKFRCAEPEFRLINPSPASVTQPMEAALNQCATDLSALVQYGAQPAQLKACIADSLRSVEKPFDTEDREYLCYYYNQLGQCVGIRVGPLLNRWLYGFLLSTLLRFSSRS